MTPPESTPETSRETAPQTTPEAALIIPHYNDVARLKRCLDALMPQLDGRVELVVVDNASTDDLSPVTAAHPRLRIVTETRKGAAEARNRGVAETTAPHLFFLDADCLPAPDWLDSAFAVRGLADVVGGAVTVFDETPPPRSGAEAFETVFAFQNRYYIERKGFSVTANLLTRRDIFEATGPFDESVSEDLDWCHRARALGYQLSYAEELRVSHPSRSDWAALRKKWRRLTHELFGVNGTGATGRAKWALKALAQPLVALSEARAVLRHPALRDGGERRAALVMLVRLRLLRMGWMLRQVAQGHVLGRS